MFAEFQGDNTNLRLSLKSQSITRWSCRWEAVRAVYQQIEWIVGCLLEMSQAKDSTTYSSARSLLRSLLDFDFVFGLVLLKLIFSNTSNLNSYVQGKDVDIYSLRQNSECAIYTLRQCCNDKSPNALWDVAMVLSNKLKPMIKDHVMFYF